MGSCSTAIWSVKRSRIESSTKWKSAPVRSILLTKHSLGTP